MWKVASGLHRASLGAFRTSLREDGQQYSQGQRLLSSLNLNTDGSIVAEYGACFPSGNFKALSTPAAQTVASQIQECGLLQQLLAVPSAGPRPHVGQPTPGLTSSTLCQPYPRKFNHGSEEDYAGNRRDGGGWSLADIFHGSTALVLTYNLIHQQRDNVGLSAYCSWKSLKHSKGASAQPIQQSNSHVPTVETSALIHDSNLSSLNQVTDQSSLLESPITNTNGEHYQKECQDLEDLHLDVESENSILFQSGSLKADNAHREHKEEKEVKVGHEFRLELDSVHGIQLLEAGHPAGLRHLQAQSRRGSSIASFYLGMAYEQGHLVSVNLVRAVKYYRTAAKQGNAEAMYNLAAFYQEGRGGLPRDPEKTELLVRRAAEAGLPAARQALGLRTKKENCTEERPERSGRELYLLGQSFESLGESAVALDMYTRALHAGYARARRAVQRLDSSSTHESSA